jgi:hypothetical protein
MNNSYFYLPKKKSVHFEGVTHTKIINKEQKLSDISEVDNNSDATSPEKYKKFQKKFKKHMHRRKSKVNVQLKERLNENQTPNLKFIFKSSA